MWESGALESRPVGVWELSALPLPSESGVDRPSKFCGGCSVVLRAWRWNYGGDDDKTRSTCFNLAESMGDNAYEERGMTRSVTPPSSQPRNEVDDLYPHARSTIHRRAAQRAFLLPEFLPRTLPLPFSHPTSTPRRWTESSRPHVGGHLTHGNGIFRTSFR